MRDGQSMPVSEALGPSQIQPTITHQCVAGGDWLSLSFGNTSEHSKADQTVARNQRVNCRLRISMCASGRTARCTAPLPLTMKTGKGRFQWLTRLLPLLFRCIKSRR